MATLNLYQKYVSPVYMPATRRGAWDASSTTEVLSLVTTKAAEAYDYDTIAVGSTTANWDVLDYRGAYVLPSAMDFSAGAISGVIGALESNAALNGYLHLHIFATIGQSNVVRCTILADLIDGEEMGATEASCGQAFSGSGAGSSICSAGDVLVVEFGYRASSSSTSYTGRLYYGAANNADLANGGNPTTNPGFISLGYTVPSVGSCPLNLCRTHFLNQGVML